MYKTFAKEFLGLGDALDQESLRYGALKDLGPALDKELDKAWQTSPNWLIG